MNYPIYKYYVLIKDEDRSFYLGNHKRTSDVSEAFKFQNYEEALRFAVSLSQSGWNVQIKNF